VFLETLPGVASSLALSLRAKKATRAAPNESIPIVTRPGAIHELGIVIVRRCSTMGQWMVALLWP